MLQGYYTAASGMMMQQRSLNTIANNLANTQTPGFKANRLLSTTFEQEMLTRLERGRYTTVGTGEPVRIVREVSDSMSIEGLVETDRALDIGLVGAGFINIQSEDGGGNLLTRNGQFDIDDEGYLVLTGKGRVLGTGGPLQIRTGDIRIDEAGNITNASTGAALGQLLLTVPAEEGALEQARSGMYRATGGTIPATAPQVQQGWLENSNVDLTEQLSAMMMAQRNFQSASQALQMIDQTYAKAVNIASV